MPNTLTRLVDKQASRHTEREALYFRRADVESAACALETLGVNPQDRLTIFSANRAEIITVDFAAYANRAIPVSLYSTCSYEQTVYILKDTSAAIMFVGAPRPRRSGHTQDNRHNRQRHP